MSEGSFESKLTAKRETSAGIYITLQVCPEDFKADLATLRVGSLLIVGWSEIVNTAVEPIAAIAQSVERQPSKLDVESSNLSGRSKTPRQFSSLPLSQQAALRCEDDTFKVFLAQEWNNEFLKYAGDAAAIVRDICGCKSSRAEFDTTGIQEVGWRACEDDYQSWLTDRQYKDSRR